MPKTYAEYAELKELGIVYEGHNDDNSHSVIITADDRLWDYDEHAGIYELRELDEEPFDDRDPTDDHNLEQ